MAQATQNGHLRTVTTTGQLEKLSGVRDMEAPRPSDLIETWATWMAGTKNLSPATIRLYRRTVEQFAAETDDFLFAQEEQIQAWLQNKGGQAGTFNNRVSGLNSFYSWARKTKLRLDNPCSDLDRPKQHKRLPKPVEDLAATLEALDEADRVANHKGVIPRRVGETRDMATFLAFTGLRIHEAVKCTWPVPCPEEAFVIGKGNKEELVQIHPNARQAWDRLGSWPIGARATQRRFEKAGVHPHMFRHYYATALVRAGVDFGTVSKMMRHSSVQTTMTYAAFKKDQYRDALGKI